MSYVVGFYELNGKIIQNIPTLVQNYYNINFDYVLMIILSLNNYMCNLSLFSPDVIWVIVTFIYARKIDF